MDRHIVNLTFDYFAKIHDSWKQNTAEDGLTRKRRSWSRKAEKQGTGYDNIYFIQTNECLPNEHDLIYPGFISCTPFHTALVDGDINFIQSLLRRAKDVSLRNFIVTAPVAYSKPCNALSFPTSALALQHMPKLHYDGILQALPKDCLKEHELKHLEAELPIQLATLGGNMEIVKLLLDNGTDFFQ